MKISSELWRSFFIGNLNGLILVMLWFIVRAYGPLTIQEIKYYWQTYFEQRERNPIVQEAIDSNQFLLNIPAIQVKATIIPQVDPANPQNYNLALQQGVAHAKGSSLPGEKGRVYLFAHSANGPWMATKNNAVFYLLHQLKTKDVIIINFQGKAFLYEVSRQEIVSPKDVNQLYAGEQPELVLQTCWPPGTTLKALLVFAQPLVGKYF